MMVRGMSPCSLPGVRFSPGAHRLAGASWPRCAGRRAAGRVAPRPGRPLPATSARSSPDEADPRRHHRPTDPHTASQRLRRRPPIGGGHPGHGRGLPGVALDRRTARPGHVRGHWPPRSSPHRGARSLHRPDPPRARAGPCATVRVVAGRRLGRRRRGEPGADAETGRRSRTGHCAAYDGRTRCERPTPAAVPARRRRISDGSTETWTRGHDPSAAASTARQGVISLALERERIAELFNQEEPAASGTAEWRCAGRQRWRARSAISHHHFDRAVIHGEDDEFDDGTLRRDRERIDDELRRHERQPAVVDGQRRGDLGQSAAHLAEPTVTRLELESDDRLDTGCPVELVSPVGTAWAGGSWFAVCRRQSDGGRGGWGP
jgi:hypothetical protein